MKHYLSTTLALACVALVISLILIKRGDDAQHESDAGSIADFSNRLDTAEMAIATCKGALLTFSNRLDESRSESLTFSNRLMEAQSTIALDAEQTTNLNQRIAGVESENQALAGRVMDLTNQVTDLTKQIALTEAILDQADKNYALLENRFRIDVAERVVVERKFNNLSELQAQMKYLKQNPAGEISAGSIYAGLGVEVKSNKVHVISTD